MKTTVVPAQITTVEDKIAGSLTFTQLLLLITPVFTSGAAFAFLPPFMNIVSYKLIFCLTFAGICLVLAIRIKGKIILSWIAVISRYNLRARHFVYNKNDLHLRRATKPAGAEIVEKLENQSSDTADHNGSPILMTELFRLEQAIIDPKANFHFKKSKKGGLRVHIQEIK